MCVCLTTILCFALLLTASRLLSNLLYHSSPVQVQPNFISPGHHHQPCRPAFLCLQIFLIIPIIMIGCLILCFQSSLHPDHLHCLIKTVSLSSPALAFRASFQPDLQTALAITAWTIENPVLSLILFSRSGQHTLTLLTNCLETKCYTCFATELIVTRS